MLIVLPMLRQILIIDLLHHPLPGDNPQSAICLAGAGALVAAALVLRVHRPSI